MDQLAIYDFPLMFHSNHGPILYRFRDKWRISVENRKVFPLLCI